MRFHPDVMGVDNLAAQIRKIPNFPKDGILFHDITTVLQSPEYFRLLVDLFTYHYMGQNIDVVAGLEARGFIIGAALAYQLNVGFVPIRKKGKLPFDTISQTYALEYGEATVEIHKDAIREGSRVLLIDDLVATGGTMLAGVELIRSGGSLRHFGIYRFGRRQKNLRKRCAAVFLVEKRWVYVTPSRLYKNSSIQAI